MKAFVTFKNSIIGDSSKKFFPDEMCNLGNFFSSDYRVFKKFNFVDDWLDDPDKFYLSGNLSYLEKKKDLIIIGDLFENEFDKKFCLSIRTFKKLLDDWEKIVSKKPKEIIITKEGDTVTVIGKN